MGAELFHADGRTDRHEETNSRLSQFYDPAYIWTFKLQNGSFFWLDLAQNTYITRDFVNKVMKLQGSRKFDEFLDWLEVGYILKKGQAIFVLSKLI